MFIEKKNKIKKLENFDSLSREQINSYFQVPEHIVYFWSGKQVVSVFKDYPSIDYMMYKN
jgi:hypothetical protein